jgi:hypothetical protein
MAAISDFRRYSFDPKRIEASGKTIGKNLYWKLYVIENTCRILVHSVLKVQLAPDWWPVAADAQETQGAARRKTDYLALPWHSKPGDHDVYYVFLTDLKEIIKRHRALFEPLIPDIDVWIGRLAEIRLPRNIVGHMNWLSKRDAKRIDSFYDDLLQMVESVVKGGKITLEVPT